MLAVVALTHSRVVIAWEAMTRCIPATALVAIVSFFGLASGCGGKSEPPPETAQPATADEPEATPAHTSSGDEKDGDKAGDEEEPESPPTGEPGPKADAPERTTVRELNPDKKKQLPDGFYFVEGVVTRLPCNACSKDADCKPGQVCPHTKPCTYCNATVIIEHDGNDIAIDHPDRDNIPPYKLGTRVRIVLEKKGNFRLYVKKGKPCPASECTDTDPSKKLGKAPGGVEVRKDGERCFAPKECGPKEKCAEGEEVRVRCP